MLAKQRDPNLDVEKSILVSFADMDFKFSPEILAKAR